MLKDYRVLDITQFIAGPICSRIMAEMGADVIKVELAPGGDHGRKSGLSPRGDDASGKSQSTYFTQHNHSKKSLALDLKDPRGLDLVKQLLPKVDVLIENFAPGAISRMGLGYDAVKAINPTIVMCSVSMAGQSGPLADQPGFDYMAAAYAGITGLIGETDRGPVQVPIAMGDNATGLAAAMAVGFALLHRERTGEGQYIDCSLLDTYTQMHEDFIPRIGIRGAKALPSRNGAHHPNGGPTGVFHAGDGRHVQIMVMPYQWPRMVAALGMPELLEDERFATPINRRTNKQALMEIIEDWMATLDGRDAVLARLAEHRVPAAPVLALDEVIQHPHMQARGTIRQAADPHLGSFPIPGLPFRSSAWQMPDNVTAPLLGAHNDEVLTELLELAPEEIEELYSAGVLVRDET